MVNGWLDFLLVLNENVGIYLFFLAIGVLLYYIICIRNIIFDLFDPMLIMLISGAFAMSVPLFMEYKDMMYQDTFIYSYIFTEGAYIAGLMVFCKYSKLDKYNIVNSEETISLRLKNIVYLFYIILFFLIKVYSYIKVGIPIFTEGSRLALSSQNGVLTRIEGCIFPVLVFLWVDSLISSKNKISDIFVGIGIVCTLLLSDSKSAILNLCAGFFFYQLYLRKFGRQVKYNLKKIYQYLGGFALIGVFVPLIAKVYFDSYEEVLIAFFVRLVAYGDIFCYFYGSAVSDLLIENNNAFNYLIEPIAASFRLISYDDVLQPIGFQITRLLENSENVFYGPNGRHNIVALLCFGQFIAPIYSFTIGLLISFVCRVVYVKCKGFNLFTFLMYCGLYTSVIKLPTEITGFVNGVILHIGINGLIFYVIYISYKSCVNK